MRIFVMFLSLLFVSKAYALGEKTRIYCASDYFQYCKDFPPDSMQTRECMVNVGEKLSKECIDALIEDGEIDKQQAKVVTPKSDFKPIIIGKEPEPKKKVVVKKQVKEVIVKKTISYVDYYHDTVQNGIKAEGVNAQFGRNK